MAANDSAPPYQRIAHSLRRRIESGHLRPGDRVPSTRAIARKWGVALATAAHALGVLNSEGLIRTVPRAGTVVANGPSKTASRALPDLTRGRIVEAAMAIADAEGLAAVSLRGVASRLGAPVTSLYRHVDGKEELLRAMTDSALGEGVLPERPPPGWRAQLELAARMHWSILRRHPRLGRTMSITRPTPLASAIAYADWILRALDGLGVDAATRMRLHIVLHAFIQGMAVNLEAEADAASETGMNDSEWMDTQLDAFTALAATGRYPAFAAVLNELDAGFELDLEALFELGLGSILDGFARIFEVSCHRPVSRVR
jgi:DNA-binding transcriptional regulator YhcF (GntR family)